MKTINEILHHKNKQSHQLPKQIIVNDNILENPKNISKQHLTNRLLC